ncbi:allantoinase, mitochondrial-like isoform X2 [Acropora palmata]|uniref:allantoinase, mitochondrial-like isoform X2 n=1 Tax=Acropora palmata TaxID=6131 RepID=UPI003D9FE23A
MADEEGILVVKAQRIVLPDSIVSGCLVVRSGKIVGIESGDGAIPWGSGAKVIDAGNLVVMPGVVDSHVHVNEPGRTEWEGFMTATQAAAAGGITTIVDMPLNSIPPTTTLEGFHTKLNCARDQCWIDVAFWGGVIPGNQFHAEVELAQGPIIPKEDPSKYSTFLESRPEDMENQAIELVIELCREYRVPCHIVHLSSASAVPMIRQARADGVPLTIETTHHYLSLTAEDVPEGATQYKCCPPVRDSKNQDSLWDALKSGDIDLVISDHSPCTVDLKRLEEGDFMAAWGGISGLQYGLSIFWSNARSRGFALHDVVRVLCEEPAKLSRLNHRKGKIALGMDADLVLWNPEECFVVDQKNTRHKNKVTPYHNMTLRGVIHKTILRGNLIYERDRVCDKPTGQLLLET